MTIAIGTDILEIERMQQVYARHGIKIVERVLTTNEIQRFNNIEDNQIQLSFLAKRWCAKEAIAKALGTGIAKGIGWQQIEIAKQESGAPYVILSGAALRQLHDLGASKALISLSDEQHYCVAFCSLV